MLAEPSCKNIHITHFDYEKRLKLASIAAKICWIPKLTCN